MSQESIQGVGVTLSEPCCNVGCCLGAERGVRIGDNGCMAMVGEDLVGPTTTSRETRRGEERTMSLPSPTPQLLPSRLLGL